MDEIIRYIIQFLLGENTPDEIIDSVGYTSDEKEFANYKLVIYPSDFFRDEMYGSPASMPSIPLKLWDETPILYGNPEVKEFGSTKVVYADIIASTYFLISRYEETINPKRDIHGRLPGKESLPYRAGFIDSPLVDEYGRLLRSYLRDSECNLAEPPKKIRKVYLTHDVDQLSHFRNFRGFMGGLLRGIKRKKEGANAIKSYFRGLKFDPWYTLPWLFKLDNSLRRTIGIERCEPVVFIKVGGGTHKEDKPFVTHHVQDFQTLINLCKRKKITFGLHSSYEAGIFPKKIADEKKYLERVTKHKTSYNRHHFLCSREPEDMQHLIETGVSHDFTLGYADVAGFRLGTCRAVKWINPRSKKLTSLTLHPLTMMDGTLSDKRYMFMNSHDAYEYCIRLINMVEYWNGELVLLWHNTSVEDTPNTYHRKLYQDIIEYLKKK